MAYTTQVLVEDYLGRVLTAKEVALFAVLLPAVKRWIDQTLGSTFDTAEASTRVYDAEGGIVDIDPVQAITKIEAVDYEGAASYAYTNGTEYVLYPQNETVKNELRARSGHGFTRGIGRIKVYGKFTEYDFAGSKVPEDIQILATRLVATQIRGLSADTVVDSAGVKKESVEGHSIEYITSESYLSQLSSSDPIISSLISTRRQLLVG